MMTETTLLNLSTRRTTATISSLGCSSSPFHPLEKARRRLMKRSGTQLRPELVAKLVITSSGAMKQHKVSAADLY